MKARNSNIELLRIVTMLAIVMHHYTGHGLGTDISDAANRYIAGVTILGGKLGNDLFVMISAYFMCKSRITGKKLAKIWGEVLFYSVTIFVAYWLLAHMGYRSSLEASDVWIGRDILIDAIFPLGSNQNWFATDYVILMMLSPVLNLALERMDKDRLLRYLIIATLFWSIIATFTDYGYGYNDLMWFCVMYLYAGYVRYYTTDHSYRRHLIIALVMFTIMALSSVSRIYISRLTGNGELNATADVYVGMNSPLTLLCAISLLLAFSKMRPFYNRCINTIASTTFGVYLIHDNRMIRNTLWSRVLGLPDSVIGSHYMVCHMAISVIAIYAVCAMIDLIRQATFEKWYMKAVDRLEHRAHAASQLTLRRLSALWGRIL